MNAITPIHLATMPPDLRKARAVSLKMAIEDCHPKDLGQILAFALDELISDGPFSSLEECLRSDAALWADCASPPELHAYFAASLKELGTAAMGVKARKRLFLTLWEGFGDGDRVAFLARVDPNGAFVGRAAA